MQEDEELDDTDLEMNDAADGQEEEPAAAEEIEEVLNQLPEE